MKIGISTSVIQRGTSGIAQYVFAVARAFLPLAERHHFSLFVLEEDLPLFEFARGRMEIIVVPETYRPPVRNILWHQTVLPRLARRAGLDVLHTPSYRRMLWSRPCALVATIHDLAPFRLRGKYDWKRMWYGKVAARRLARRQDEIIVVSRNTGQDVETYFGIPRAKLTVIHNGVDHQRFFPDDHEEAKAAVAKKHRITGPFFLCVARLEHPAKNHVRLIKAFNQFKAAGGPGWKLVLGGSDWHGAEVIHEFIRKSPYAGDISCLGFVPDRDLPMWYRAADIFLYPSLFEGFGLPVLEAMACGCPVICSERGALGEIAGEAAAIVVPEDAGSIQEQMSRLALAPRERDAFIAKGLRRALDFDWKNVAAATLRVYEKALGKKCRARPGLDSSEDSRRRMEERSDWEAPVSAAPPSKILG